MIERRGWMLLLPLMLLACRTPNSPPPINLNEPLWLNKHGQAVWTPSASAPEIAADLIVATHPSGRSFVQFTKTPFPLLTAQQDPTHWRVHFQLQNRKLAGKNPAPDRLLWPHLPGILLNGAPPPPPWFLTREEQGRWLLQNQSTGESLEGFLSP